MLEIKDVCYEVNDNGEKKVILDHISFSLEDDILAVITGQNGSGKSTLAKIIMGIIKPTSGKILYNGKDISKYDITKRAKLGFAFAFQQPVVFKGITVKQLLDLASGKENSVTEACHILSKVGLCARDYIEREVNNKLSGGELKRIELAMIIARDAKVNICDEPEAGIDLWSFDALVNLFKEKKGLDIIISHQNRIIDIADKIILLKAGKIEKIGAKEEVMPHIVNQRCERLKEGE
ncbi:MAG: ATP-binding cassette domain-containing protein [Clostridia bacterium]|nr:ATP-binding cassette domain-containing protein [Clostridia bacterium]